MEELPCECCGTMTDNAPYEWLEGGCQKMIICNECAIECPLGNVRDGKHGRILV